MTARADSLTSGLASLSSTSLPRCTKLYAVSVFASRGDAQTRAGFSAGTCRSIPPLSVRLSRGPLDDALPALAKGAGVRW